MLYSNLFCGAPVPNRPVAPYSHIIVNTIFTAPTPTENQYARLA